MWVPEANKNLNISETPEMLAYWFLTLKRLEIQIAVGEEEIFLYSS